MAFGKKYYSSYKSNNNIDYYLEIWLKDYDSTASEITLGAGGPVITYETEEDDRFSPILSSNCKLPLMVTNTLLQTFVSQLRTTYQEKQVYLHLYKATSSTYTTTKPIWSGFLTMDLGSGEDVSFPYEQELIFVDGLSLLKEIDFVDFSDPDYETRTAGNYAPENMYWGPARYTYWIKEILLKSGAAISGANGQGVTQDYGFTTAVNWYNGTMTSTSQSSDPLYLTECKASMFHTKDENETFLPDNCYDVLKELLRHWGARITYWKHEFWIVQIPEYIVDESGFIDNPDNINSRQYNKSGTYLGSQNHLGDTYSSRYEQTIQSDQISKLVGTKYNYLPAIHRVNAKFLSLNGENHFGGFPFGANPYGIDFFQSRIANPSSADFLWVSIPLNWKWDMSGTALPNGHTNGWWARIRFNLYCTQNNGGTITTYYLQYKSSDDSYYWVDSSNWTPLGNESPAYIISSRNLVETDYIGFQEQIEFVDSSGSSISLTGDWDFYMSIENYGTSSNNPGSFYCRFSGYNTGYVKRNPTGTAPSLPAPGGGGASTGSGTVSWSNSLQDNSISFNSPTASSTNFPSGYNTGASQVDKAFTWKSPLKGFLQVLSNTVNATYGITNDTIVSNSSNTEVYGFGDLLWGDSIVQTARGNLNVWNGSAFTKTNVNGKWGRGSLTGEKTFTQMLIDEFLTGQIQVVISPSMRLVVGEQNKNQTATASGGGTATRPRYVNPIGRLRETRSNETDPEYFFRRGSFHTLYDEWDYEGYQILRDTITVTTNTNDIGGLGGSQDDNPIDAAKVKSNVETALMMNSPVAYVRTTVPATGSNVIVNGNFNVATGWTLGTGWTIDTTTKKAKFAATGSTSDLVQSVLTAELTYQINFTVEVTAGNLIVKAGSTGTSQTITTSGDYSIYLDCEGSTDIKFTAGTTFTGTITYITAKDQKSISSIPINVIGSTVFKTNDTLDLVNSRDGEIMTLNVSSNQGASDDTISVTSTPLFEDVAANSVLLINQDDLSAQYQNKTKGTVGGFDITATSIDSGSVAISSYIDDDSFGTASATSLATSESIKAYVDTQVGSADTLAEVLANGNTTGGNNISVNDNDKITFGASSDLEIYHTTTNGSFIRDVGSGNFNIQTDGNGIFIEKSTGPNMGVFRPDAQVELYYNGSEKFRTTNSGISITGGGVFTDQVTIPATPVASTDAASKSYVDAQVGTADTLQEVTDLGNTTTNSIRIGSSSAPAGGVGLHVDSEIRVDGNDGVATKKIRSSYFSSSQNITIESGSSANIIHNIGSTEKMRLTNTGLGIGTATPSRPLHVKNTSSQTVAVFDGGNNSAGEIGFLSNGTSGDTYVTIGAVANDMSFSAGASERMRLTSAGRLGIGTTSPSRKLEATSTSSYVAVLNSSQNNSFLSFNDANTSGDTYVAIGSENGDLISRAGNTERMRLTTDGKLGIGTSSPNSILEVGNNSGSHAITINKSTTGTGTLYFDNDGNHKVYIQADSGEHLRIGVNNSEKLCVLESGNVGIGTSSPSEKLEVVGSILIEGTSDSRLYLGSNLGQTFSLGTVWDGSYDSMFIEYSALGTPKVLSIRGNGNVGIGTTTASEKLHVVGDALITGDSHADTFKPAVSGNPIKFKRYDGNEVGRFKNNGYFGINVSDPQRSLDIGGAVRVLNENQIEWGWGGVRITGSVSTNTFKIGTWGGSSVVDRMTVETDGQLNLSSYGSGSFTGTETYFLAVTSGGDVVEADSSALPGGPYLPLTGGTLTGSLTGQSIILGDGSTNEKLRVYYSDSTYVNLLGYGLEMSRGTNYIRPTVTNTNGLRIGNHSLNWSYVSNYATNHYWYNASTELMRLTSGGNLLIGTTTDSGDKLNVNGDIKTDNIKVLDGSAASPSILFYNDNDTGFYRNDTGNITFTSNGSNKIRLNSSGLEVFSGYLKSTSLDINGNSDISGTAKIDGNVSIGGSVGAVYKLDVVGKQRVQSVLELEDVLTLNAISTPADPANNKSSIYMDSADGAIKVKINVEGTVVTRTIASFE